MKLFEYQSMRILREYGIPAPRGQVAENPDEAARITGELGGRGVVKAQVLTGGRGKQGGVKVVRSPDEARDAAARILALTIHGIPVRAVMVAEAIDIVSEFYAGVVVNRNARRAEFVFSDAGGIEIEEVAAAAPEKIIRIPADPFSGLDESALRAAVGPSFRSGEALDQAIPIMLAMYRLFTERDCSLMEINPLAFTVGGRLVALDAKIEIDDNSLLKHPDLESLRNPEEYSADEIDARNGGLSFVGLDGNIGCMVNGAGLAMATMDLVKHFGGEPANFLDVGGSSSPQKVVDAIRILLRNVKTAAILMNIFGGITRCDDIAKGVIMARDAIGIPIPFIIRMIGTNDAQAREMLTRENFHTHEDLSSAVRMAVEAARMRR